MRPRAIQVAAPPLDRWSLTVGDAIHNLRSALDALVWSSAIPEELTAAQARQVQFPICARELDRDRRAPVALRSVPSDVVERIRGWQMSLRPDAERLHDPLPALNELDLHDKHAEASFEQAIQFASDAAAARNAPPQVVVHEPSLAPGSLLITGTTSDPIKRLSGEWSMALGLEIDTMSGAHLVFELIHTIAVYVEILIWKVTDDPRGEPFSH